MVQGWAQQGPVPPAALPARAGGGGALLRVFLDHAHIGVQAAWVAGQQGGQRALSVASAAQGARPPRFAPRTCSPAGHGPEQLRRAAPPGLRGSAARGGRPLAPPGSAPCPESAAWAMGALGAMPRHRGPMLPGSHCRVFGVTHESRGPPHPTQLNPTHLMRTVVSKGIWKAVRWYCVRTMGLSCFASTVRCTSQYRELTRVISSSGAPCAGGRGPRQACAHVGVAPWRLDQHATLGGRGCTGG